jgi:RNA polymerase sigma-70 factor (ECF subfamily)
MLRRVHRWAGRGADAEDLLQTAYERLYRAGDRTEIRTPSAFVYRAAVNAGIDHARKDSLFDTSFDIENDGPLLADGAPMPDEVLVSRQRLERVREGIRQLSPRTREIFLMHRLEGIKYREIAANMGISQSAVEKHIAKATMFLTDWTEGW